MKLALKNRDEFRLGVLRLLTAALGNKEIDKHAKCVQAGKSSEPLTDEECGEVLAKEYKQRQESALAYEQGGRLDLQEAEKKEAEIIKTYLPQMLSEAEVKKRILELKESLGKGQAPEKGMMMKTLSQEFRGKADMSLVARLVNELLKE